MSRRPKPELLRFSQNYSGSRAISIVRNPYPEEIDRRPFRGTRQPAGQWQGEQERARLDRRRDLRWNTASDQRLLSLSHRSKGLTSWATSKD